jgi:hypothetical protein
LGLVLSWRKPHARTHTQSKMVAEGHEWYLLDKVMTLY